MTEATKRATMAMASVIFIENEKVSCFKFKRDRPGRYQVRSLGCHTTELDIPEPTYPNRGLAYKLDDSGNVVVVIWCLVGST